MNAQNHMANASAWKVWRLLAIALLFLFTLPAPAAIKLAPAPIPELRPLRETLPPAAESKPIDMLPWFIAAGIVAVVAAILTSLPRKLPPPPTPPYAIVRRRLQGLCGTSATPAALSAIFRDYLLDAYHVPARGSTPGELIDWLSAHPRWDNQLSEEATVLLEAYEVAKFSPIPPTDHPEAIEQMRSLLSRIERRRTRGLTLPNS